MIAQVLQVARVVALELIAIDDDRRLRLALPAFHLLRVVRRIGVADDEHEPRAVGRPRVVVDAALHVGELLRLAAGAVQQPDLRPLLLLVLVAARRRECEVLPVRAPPRTRLAVLARRQLDRLRAVDAHHPDVAVPLVLLDVDQAHRVGNPLAVGRDLRVGDVLELREIVEGERPLRGLGRRGEGQADSRGQHRGEHPTCHRGSREKKGGVKDRSVPQAAALGKAPHVAEASAFAHASADPVALAEAGQPWQSGTGGLKGLRYLLNTSNV